MLLIRFVVLEARKRTGGRELFVWIMDARRQRQF